MKSKIEVKINRLTSIQQALEFAESMQSNFMVWDAEQEKFVMPYDESIGHHAENMQRIAAWVWLYDELVKLSDKV